ncbi:uncharacterized protein LOC119733713 [Patiria miniata]|uniref:Uncharacterized protein n=1 Tax=Patiria miniata TaxID=46514 RepID=A0A914AI38_PATMI|nr:uncharacterized protein LOC119733713 [Patiria miniata]
MLWEYTKMRRSFIHWALLILLEIAEVLVSCHQVCFIGREYSPQSGIPLRWFLPNKDPCECTAMRLGGMRIPASSYRQGAPRYLEQLIVSEDPAEIQTFFTCKGISAVEKITTDTSTVIQRFTPDTSTVVERFTTDTSTVVERFTTDTSTVVERFTTDTSTVVERFTTDTASGPIRYPAQGNFNSPVKKLEFHIESSDTSYMKFYGETGKLLFELRLATYHTQISKPFASSDHIQDAIPGNFWVIFDDTNDAVIVGKEGAVETATIRYVGNPGVFSIQISSETSADWDINFPTN